MLRIAVPNKGMLSEPAWNMLSEAGYRLRSNPRQLVVEDPDNDIELFYLRPLDIAVYVGRGTIDVGITGHDLLLNSGTEASEHMELGFGASTFRFAAPNDSDFHTLQDIQGKRVGTSFDKLVHDYLVAHGIEAETIHLDGAVESSVQLGVADLIADVVSTGTTLRNAGLRIFADPIMHSEAVLIRSPRLDPEDERLTILSRRLQGVLTAQRYVLMDYDIPVARWRPRRGDPRIREPDRIPAARQAVECGARDGAQGEGQPADGQAVRGGCPGHHRDRAAGLPHVTNGVRQWVHSSTPTADTARRSSRSSTRSTAPSRGTSTSPCRTSSAS